MSFRLRLTLAFVALATIPLLLFGYGVHRALRERLDAEARAGLDAAEVVVGQQLDAMVAPLRARVTAAAEELGRDNRFRLALADERAAEREWLLDWAAGTMRTSGLALLQLYDAEGRILSSGHFRNEFGRVAPEMVWMFAEDPSTAAVVDVRTPGGRMRGLIVGATFGARGQRFVLVGGVPFDSARVAALSPDPSIAVLLEPGSANGGAAAPSRSIFLTYLDDAASRDVSTARLELVHDLGPTRALQASVRNAMAVAVALTMLLALVVAALLGRRIARPLASLADRTALLDLDRLDQRFSTGRDDEIGMLERTLDSLTGRLRASAARLRDAERAAATGDLARQVNHDIKNGLTPIRNVLRHLVQVAEREPSSLAPTFLGRKGTLESSVEYLDTLARNYAKLSPSLDRGPTDLRPLVAEIARTVSTATVDMQMPDSLPPVRADAVVLRRILDNLIANAVEALDGQPGTITIVGSTVGEGAERRVRVQVSDTGRGMTRAELDRAFEDFHTTKPSGTGLGLSVVRRLLIDVGGSVRAETAPGEGTTFTIELPTV